MFTIRNLSLAMATTVAAKSAENTKSPEQIRKDSFLIGAAGSTFGVLAHDYQIEKQLQGLNDLFDENAIDLKTGKVVKGNLIATPAQKLALYEAAEGFKVPVDNAALSAKAVSSEAELFFKAKAVADDVRAKSFLKSAAGNSLRGQFAPSGKLAAAGIAAVAIGGLAHILQTENNVPQEKQQASRQQQPSPRFRGN